MATATPARIPTLDLVRGVAVMGILLLNIIAFGLPESAYFNPRAYGGSEGADLAVRYRHDDDPTTALLAEVLVAELVAARWWLAS